ncbi:hypothetical protein GUJ93_ZPchr0009g1724 [Zizania palustris]|uniref:Uncharacterized protein n=1 Tax=Zizania palustris TaxID=103762 RepID=A0A8J5R165_ZIZPA|nr:hypothetical protein GUJ93_ZPchr0009g1724 [Zizania palustris]
MRGIVALLPHRRPPPQPPCPRRLPRRLPRPRPLPLPLAAPIISQSVALFCLVTALLNPVDMEEWHDCLPDLSASTDGDDFSDLEDL